MKKLLVLSLLLVGCAVRERVHGVVIEKVYHPVRHGIIMAGVKPPVAVPTRTPERWELIVQGEDEQGMIQEDGYTVTKAEYDSISVGDKYPK